jgi:hypothetical protein
MEPPEGLKEDEYALWWEKKLIPVQNRVCNALKLWLESFWIEQYDDDCLDDIHALVSGPITENHPQLASKLLELVSRKVKTCLY